MKRIMIVKMCNVGKVQRFPGDLLKVDDSEADALVAHGFAAYNEAKHKKSKKVKHERVRDPITAQRMTR